MNQVKVVVSGTIEIDDVTAFVLEHICSYSLADFFADKCSHEFTAETIKKTLDKLRSEMEQINAARKRATEAINWGPRCHIEAKEMARKTSMGKGS